MVDVKDVRETLAKFDGMSAQTIRLHMGEMTAQEVRTARAAIGWVTRSVLSTLPDPSGESERVEVDKVGLPQVPSLPAEQESVASIVPEHCTGATFAFITGILHVRKDGGGYLAVDEDDWTLEDDRCEGPDGPQGSVHWITRFPPGELEGLRDFLNGTVPAEALSSLKASLDAALRRAEQAEAKQVYADRAAALVNARLEAAERALAAECERNVKVTGYVRSDVFEAERARAEAAERVLADRDAALKKIAQEARVMRVGVPGHLTVYLMLEKLERDAVASLKIDGGTHG